MKYILFLALHLAVHPLIASDPTLSKKEKQSWGEALELIEIKDYSTAKLYLDELYVKYSDWGKLNYQLGVCNFHLKNINEFSQKTFEKASRDSIPMAFYYLGRLAHYQNKYALAISMYQDYLKANGEKVISAEEIQEYIARSKRAQEYSQRPQDMEIINMGNAINSKFPEYAPLITSAEDMLFFTSRRENSTGGKLDPYGKYFEDVYVSMFENEKWNAPIQMGTNINDNLHNAGVGLSPEGNTLILFKTDKTWTAGDLYWSEYSGKAWSDPVLFPDQINSKHIESSASFTPDGNTLYFSSDRPGGFGGKDLYKVVKLPNGAWSFPTNLGDKINTKYDDDAPFIHPNSKTLYFSSNGHETMGDFDIFYSEWNEESGWSAPENMGCPINTSRDDVFFTVSADGKTGYFSSVRDGGFGDQDLYQVKLVREPIPIIRGKVVSSIDTLTPVKATITLENALTNQVLGIYKTNAQNGRFIIIANNNQPYKINIQAENYEVKDLEITFYREDFVKTKLFILPPSK